MLRVSRCVRGESKLVSILASGDATGGAGRLTFAAMLDRPLVSSPSLPFIPPPRWAAELSRRLHRTFPALQQRHHTRYLQAFIHPSFTTSEAEHATMRRLSPLGEALLTYALSHWVHDTFASLSRAEVSSLLASLGSDAELSRLLRDEWDMEGLVLTDAAAALFTKANARSTRGLVRWLAANSTQHVPDSCAAECVKAVIGAVLLEEGMHGATSFTAEHVLPHLGSAA